MVHCISKSGLYCWVDKRGDVVPDAEKLIEKCCNCEANDVRTFPKLSMNSVIYVQSGPYFY